MSLIARRDIKLPSGARVDGTLYSAAPALLRRDLVRRDHDRVFLDARRAGRTFQSRTCARPARHGEPPTALSPRRAGLAPISDVPFAPGARRSWPELHLARLLGS